MFVRFLFLLFFIGTFAIGAVYVYGQSSDEPALAAGSKIDRLVVNKAKREMLAYEAGTLVKNYKIALGFNPVGHKQFEGDGKTPEGEYRINERNPNSGYYKNLGVSYPNQADRDYAASQNRSPGGLIKLHGLPNYLPNIGKLHLLQDWTNGCIAVNNDEMQELFDAVVPDAVIQINP